MAYPWARRGALLGVFLGLFAFFETQLVLARDQHMGNIQKLCAAGNETAVKEAGLHDYEPKLGGPVTCLLTNFMYDLVTREKGLLVWGITIVMIYPLTLLMYTEAGRAEARYLVKWPIFVYFLGQLLGISLTFPAMWLPCVFLGHGTGATSKSRVLTAMLPAPIVSFMTYVCFFWDTSSYAWTLSAGLLTGIGIPLAGLFTLPFPAPEKRSSETGAVVLLQKAYLVFAAISAFGYYFLIWMAFHFKTPLLTGLWGGNASVAFMTVDSVVVFLGLLLYVLITCNNLAWLAAVLTPFIGPGAAFCAVLWNRERLRERQQGLASEALLG